MDSLTTALKVFVVAAGIVLVLGFALLAALLWQRSAAPDGSGTAEVELPAGKVEEIEANGRRVLLLVAGEDGVQWLVTVDPLTGRRYGLVRLGTP